MRFEGKVVFVTGGSRGLGKELARAFLAEGASVAVNGRGPEALARFREELEGKPVRAYQADVTDYGEMEAVLAKVVETWGRVDVLVNNAGIVNPLVPAEKVKKEDFDRVIDTNLKAVFYVTQIFGKRMLEQGSGRVITVSSQAALFGEKGFLPYAVSKAGLMVMTRNLASEWSKSGVTLCCLAPGLIAGGMNEGLIRKQALVDLLAKRAAVGRLGEVKELTETVLFLASPAASYINGETIVMDGGMTGFEREPLIDALMKGR